MGSGASTPPPPTDNNATQKNGKTELAKKATESIDIKEKEANNKVSDIEQTDKTLVRSSHVAPIIIKNCKEEFQHVTDFTEPIVYGQLAANLPEHALVKNQYFLVSDMDETCDVLKTYKDHLAPNLRCVEGGRFPIYGMGQPTKNGLAKFLQKQTELGYENIIVVNMRSDPVLFLKHDWDMLPYRTQEGIKEGYTGPTHDLKEISKVEVALRKEIIDLSSLREDNKFFFYNDVQSYKDDPHKFKIAYEDDLAVTEEVFSEFSFNHKGIRYLRMCMPPSGLFTEENIDSFIATFQANILPVLGHILMQFMTGNKNVAKIAQHKSNDYNKNADFFVIRQLENYLQNGAKIKQEVDSAVDDCGNLVNLRLLASKAKEDLDAWTQSKGNAEQARLLTAVRTHLERYFYLICFNAYLHEQYGLQHCSTFSTWMRQNPALYRILSMIDVSERMAPASLLSNGERCLLMDDYPGLDVLSSQIDVKTSNFRRVPGLPVYGMAQPNKQGLKAVSAYLTSEKISHPSVVFVNLREDLVIECDDVTYSVRESSNMVENINMDGISDDDINILETALANEIKATQTFQVYPEITDQPVTKQFTCVRTALEMFEEVRKEEANKRLKYKRLPLNNDGAPFEYLFESILTLVQGLTELDSDEDGPAIVFNCRTGRGRTTTAMAIAGLIILHRKGFPYGTKPGEEERVSLKNAQYTKGNYEIVQDLVRRIPNGHQVKREADFILDQCSDTMTPMHYHVREIIFVNYNKVKKAKNDEEMAVLKKRSIDQLERYMYLILFNLYLHCERREGWKLTFSGWFDKVAEKAGIYDLLDSVAFIDFDPTPDPLCMRKVRWTVPKNYIHRGEFI